MGLRIGGVELNPKEEVALTLRRVAGSHQGES